MKSRHSVNANHARATRASARLLLARHTRMALKLSGVTLYINWKRKWMLAGPTSRHRGFDRPQLLSYLAHRPDKRGPQQRSPPPHIPSGTKPHINEHLALLFLLELYYTLQNNRTLRDMKYGSVNHVVGRHSSSAVVTIRLKTPAAVPLAPPRRARPTARRSCTQHHCQLGASVPRSRDADTPGGCVGEPTSFRFPWR